MSEKNLVLSIGSIALALSEDDGYEYYHIDDELRELAKDASDVQTENAKLRELARRFGEYVSQDRCEGCVMKRRCNNSDIEECWQLIEIRALANELGIEVDE